jgi:hypothetical protein
MMGGPVSSVGIATDYGLHGSGFESSGFGGLGVCMLASGTQDRGFSPDRSRRIFPAGKIHSMQYDTIQTTIESPTPEQRSTRYDQIFKKKIPVGVRFFVHVQIDLGPTQPPVERVPGHSRG